MNVLNSWFFIVLLIANLFFLFFFKNIQNFFNIYDYPNKIRKLHKKKVFLGGGLLIIFNLIILVTFIFFDLSLDEKYFYSLRSYISFFIVPVFLFFLGYFDDKWNLSANLRLVLVAIIVYFAITIDNELLITKVEFYSLEKFFYLQHFAIPFTILCFLLFINSFNMFDGINLQAGFYSFFIFLILYLNQVMQLLSLFFLLIISLFLILNYFNKIFLGESGSILLSYYISYFLIKSYNVEKIFLADQIFVLLLFPGLDMIRLFFFRIAKGKNPFFADANHIHHLLLNQVKPFATFVIIAFAYIIPITLSFFLKNYFFAVVLTLIIYIVLFMYGKYSKKN